jgi:hypothetical protein
MPIFSAGSAPDEPTAVSPPHPRHLVAIGNIPLARIAGVSAMYGRARRTSSRGLWYRHRIGASPLDHLGGEAGHG